MSGVVIRGRTPRGVRAIEQIMAADDGREDWKTFFTEKIKRKGPYLSVVVEHKTRLARSMVSSEYLAVIAKKQMSETGAVDGLDYEVKTL